ncbi:mitochondrial ribonuclease P catalytic subunit [Engraulis encrasicolus]|uniref:mitochondrial ribonuclease P catalytic subunit n=1 Tax=Engraulis encrasicolus TaxID=184585 RepID=UPI002FCF3C5A
MGSLLIPRIGFRILPVIPRISRLPHKNIPQQLKVGGTNTFSTKNVNSVATTKRKAFKSDFTPKERPTYHNSVFAAGTAKRTAERFQKRNDVSDSDSPESPEGLKKRPSLTVPDHPLPPTEWRKIKATFERPDRFEIGMMLRIMVEDADINIAKSLLTFVAVDTGTIPYELLLKYLTFCVKSGHYTEMYDVYDIMKSQFGKLDTGAYSLLIKGYSKTERWRETLVLLEDISRIITPSSRNYADTIGAAVQHGSCDTAWTLYSELLDKGVTPTLDIWRRLFEGGIVDHEHDEKLLSVLQHMRDNQMYPDEALADLIRKWFESRPGQKWSGEVCRVTARGVCRNCSSKLESIELTEEDYAELKNSVMKNVIEGKDVFKKTTPEELKSFKEFVSKQPPFDVVIDGLNVANMTAGQRGSQSETLLAVVSEFSQQGLSILVLGRKHMLHPTPSWKRHHMNQIQQKAHCFFTANISEDDPFLLYATLHSGNHCNFVSRDLMRDHKACMPDGRTRRLFFKWQRGHQIVIGAIVPGKRPRLQKIQSYDTIIQSDANTWHIPYDEEGVERCTYEVPQKWLCLTDETDK